MEGRGLSRALPQGRQPTAGEPDTKLSGNNPTPPASGGKARGPAVSPQTTRALYLLCRCSQTQHTFSFPRVKLHLLRLTTERKLNRCNVGSRSFLRHDKVLHIFSTSNRGGGAMATSHAPLPRRAPRSPLICITRVPAPPGLRGSAHSRHRPRTGTWAA